MTTMMQHPKHGKHPATGHEVEHMKANGWTICPPKPKADAEAGAPPAEAPAKQGRGRKPQADAEAGE